MMTDSADDGDYEVDYYCVQKQNWKDEEILRSSSSSDSDDSNRADQDKYDYPDEEELDDSDEDMRRHNKLKNKFF